MIPYLVLVAIALVVSIIYNALDDGSDAVPEGPILYLTASAVTLLAVLDLASSYLL